jgi:predicted acylesterase/phospholipase RssA
VSIPGLFPPLREGERILVDGAVRDNVPVASLRRQHPTPLEVIAIDVGKQGGVAAGALSGSGAVSGWRHMADRLNPRSSIESGPSVAGLMMRVLELSGQDSADDADLIIRPDLSGLSITKFRQIELFEKAGYDATLAALA